MERSHSGRAYENHQQGQGQTHTETGVFGNVNPAYVFHDRSILAEEPIFSRIIYSVLVLKISLNRYVV